MANQLLYGFTKLADLVNERVTTVGIDKVSTAIQETVAEHNRQMNTLLNLFCTRTTKFQMRYRTASVARLMGLDESGRSRPIRLAGHYDIAFPLQMAGLAWGNTSVAAAKMTVQEANDYTSTLITADLRWMRDHILAALFTNASWTFTDEEFGSLTVYGLANSDSTLYQIIAGADSGATDTHYLAQANAIDNSNDPFSGIYTELMEHPENGGEVIALIPTSNKAAVMGLSGFNAIADPNIQSGNASDRLIGSLGTPVPGKVFGYHDAKVWLVEWRSMPNDYIIAVPTQGERPLAMREDAEAELTGFRQVATFNEHPFYRSDWQRRAGFGAYNRVGAVVQRVGTGSYAIPTNYTSPMA